MTIHFSSIAHLSPTTLGIMYNDLARRLDDNDPTEMDATYRGMLREIEKALASYNFRMKFIPATYKLASTAPRRRG